MSASAASSGGRDAVRHDYRLVQRRPRSKYRCRCSRCERRRTTRVHPDYARRTVRCACGSARWRIDWYRTAKLEARRTTCRCDALPFPHRRGSGFHESRCP